MKRRVMIGVFVVMGSVALWLTDAVAATCLQYRTLGGSSVCCKWSTKGVQVEVDFNQACTTDGEESSSCTANATATTTDSIAFCQNTSTGVITRRECSNQVTFTGTSGTCVPKHDPQDVDPNFPGEPGHEHHGCTTNFVLASSSCASCCQTGETCVDVTPVEMATQITAFVNFGGDFSSLDESPAGPGCSSSSSSSSCTWTEHCSINPKKIELNGVREYQCNLETVSNGGGDD
jgi:hypothetical protein